MTTIASVVVQTHWDREWYLTNEDYSARLLRIMPGVLRSLDKDQIETFMFDGQTAALEDFLTHCEYGVGQRIIQYIQQGRIGIGPWYVMPDEFLCSGESLIRNIEEGLRVSKKYGETKFLGYLPDTFGHVAQMPQILRGFGIDRALVWRGVNINDDLFEWRSPNGDAVHCLFLPEGYYQQPFSKENYLQAVTDYFERLSKKVPQVSLLLTQGGDHLAPPDDLKDRLKHYNSSQDKYRLRLTTLLSYIDERLAERNSSRLILNGELRANSNAFVLPDVLSTRRYLKRLNQEAEDRLIGKIEPLLAAVEFGDDYPEKYVRDTWKLLLQQHAHDSICGCSIDEVHQEMIVRFRRIEDRLNALQTMASEKAGFSSPYVNRPYVKAVDQPSPFADDSILTVFNPSLKQRAGWHKVEVFLEGDKASKLSITGKSGCEYKTVLLNSKKCRNFQSPFDDFPEHRNGFAYELFVDLKILGWESRVLYVKKAVIADTTFTSHSDVSDREDSRPRAISNSLVSVKVTVSGLQIENLMSGEVFESAISLVSESDAGDSYNYSPPPEPWTAQAEISKTTVRNFVDKHREAVSGGEIEIFLRLKQPVSLDERRVAGADNYVVSHGILTLRLLEGESFVRASMTWTNRAKDHRLRLIIPLKEKIKSTLSDSAFALIERPLVYREERNKISKSETAVSVNPSYSYIQAGAVRIAHLAMQEFEVLDDGTQDRLAITLVRSVGWLSRRDLITRGVAAGPDFETPEAQCLGKDSFSFLLSVGNHGALQLSDAERFRRPPLNLRGEGRLRDRLLQLADSNIQVSSCRRLGNDIEVRLFNPSSQRAECRLTGAPYRYVDLSGNPAQRNTSDLEAGEIVTLLVSNQ